MGPQPVWSSQDVHVKETGLAVRGWLESDSAKCELWNPGGITIFSPYFPHLWNRSTNNSSFPMVQMSYVNFAAALQKGDLKQCFFFLLIIVLFCIEDRDLYLRKQNQMYSLDNFVLSIEPALLKMPMCFQSLKFHELQGLIEKVNYFDTVDYMQVAQGTVGSEQPGNMRHKVKLSVFQERAPTGDLVSQQGHCQSFLEVGSISFNLRKIHSSTREVNIAYLPETS